MIAIGIDPGLTGAIAFIGPNTIAVEDLPTMELAGNGTVRRRIDGMALAQLVRRHVPAGEVAEVFCEHVGNVGGKENRTMAQGSLMRTLGAIEAAFDILRMPFTLVVPRSWKGFYDLGSDKAASLRCARTLYPVAPLKLAKHQNRAEALLIAHWGMRKVCG